MSKEGKIARRLIQWYWSEGHERRERYELSPGVWLDGLYKIAESEERIDHASRMQSGTIALWGPSQTGKSTLLSNYIDAGADDYGNGSALDWGTPVRFSVGKINDGSATFVNPYNGGMDASGCISQLRMVESVEDANHPVEVILATPAELIHALAAGFATECRPTGTGTDIIGWDTRSVHTLVSEFESKGGAFAVDQGGTESSSAYELLREVVGILEMLRLGGMERFSNIPSEELPLLKKRILQSSALLQSRDKAMAFACRLFWNGSEPFNKAYNSLRRKLEALDAPMGRAGCRKVFASFGAAAIFLDIAAYAKLKDRESSDPGWLPRRARSLRYSCTPAGVTIGEDGENALIVDEIDLALLQGVIWKLIIPLKAGHVAEHSPPLARLLKKATIVDFPGASNEGKRAEEWQLLPDSLDKDPMGLIYTRVLKRGKTSSIVASAARHFDIDCFCILAKTEGTPGSPYQLVNGVDAWWKTLTGTPIHKATQRDLPLNLVLTRWNKLINDALVTPTAIPEALSILNTLDILIDPRVTSIIGINPPTPAVPPLCAIIPDEKDRDKAFERLTKSALFQGKFGHHIGSLREIFTNPDGGSEYLLEQLSRDIDWSPRKQMLQRIRRENQQTLHALFGEAAPGQDDPQVRRETVLNKWSNGIEASLRRTQDSRFDASGTEQNGVRNAAQHVGHQLRRFLEVSVELLDPLPMNIRQCPPKLIENYLLRQVRTWMETSRLFHELKVIGLDDVREASDVLDYIAASFEPAPVREWLRTWADVRDRKSALEWRLHLAFRISRSLTPEFSPFKPHQQILKETFDKLDEFDKREAEGDDDYRLSPHYDRVIDPVMKMIQRIKSSPIKNGRPTQPGDASVLELFNDFKSQPDVSHATS